MPVAAWLGPDNDGLVYKTKRRALARRNTHTAVWLGRAFTCVEDTIANDGSNVSV